MQSNPPSARVLDGKGTAAAIRAEVAEGCARLAASGVVPGLAVVLVGDDPASAVYVRNKEKAAQGAGMRSRTVRLPAGATEAEILSVVEDLNRDPEVHGLLVQLPLPEGVDPRRVVLAIDPGKDVDGLHPENAGRLLLGLPGPAPCTPSGVIELLKRNGIPLAGRRAVVIGRSDIVGKPMGLLLLREHCTVTLCHSRTRDLSSVAAEAEILVAAIGRPGFVTGEFVRAGAVVVDVGVNRIEDRALASRLFGADSERLGEIETKGSTLVGDVHPLEVGARAGWLTPVPGGVGPLTIAMLLANTLRAAGGGGPA